VTDRSTLERGYRRLLRWYPSPYRRENERELLGVLMDATPPGRRRPGFAASADLITSGLWMRLRPGVPRSVRTVCAAVQLMYVGAAITALALIDVLISLARGGRGGATLRLLGHRQPLAVDIVLGSIVALFLVALWMWMARANGRGDRRARIFSTVLLALATLHLSVSRGLAQLVFAVAIWLVGLAAVWLLWRPASSKYFDEASSTLAGHGQPSPLSH